MAAAGVTCDVIEDGCEQASIGPDRVKTQDREVAIIETGITMLTF